MDVKVNYTTLKIKSLISSSTEKPLLSCFHDKTEWSKIGVGEEVSFDTGHSILNRVFLRKHSLFRNFSFFLLCGKSMIINDNLASVSSPLLKGVQEHMRQAENNANITHKQSQKKTSETQTRGVIGLDAEWSSSGIENKIITYQLWNAEIDEGLIVLCRSDVRWTWKAMICWVTENWGITDHVYVSHYNLAEVSAFSDSPAFLKRLGGVHNIRDSIIAQRSKYRYHDAQRNKREITISLFDTINITGSSLDAIGAAIGYPKINNPLISNMGVCFSDHQAFYAVYSIVDAIIVTQFYNSLQTFTSELGISNVTTGSQIGQKYALTILKKQDFGYKQQTHTYKEKGGSLKTINEWILPRHISSCVDGYHGARNETYVHGVFSDDWYDYDVVGAYANAMLMIQNTDWTSPRHIADPESLDPNDMGSMCVDFRFHTWVMYPSFPVEIDSSLVFPRSGRATISPIDLWTAHKNGWLAYVYIRYSTVYPKKMGFPFIGIVKTIQEGRAKYEKGHVMNLLWKLLGNGGLYGKLAQGISQTTEYDLEASLSTGRPTRRTSSQGAIFNPAIAGYITGALRSICSEYINTCAQMNIMVINNTTDGFQINAQLTQGLIKGEGLPLCSFFRDRRVQVLGDTESNNHVVELKHFNAYVPNESLNVAIQNRNYFMLSTRGSSGKLISRGGVSTRSIEPSHVQDYLFTHYLTASSTTTSNKTTLSSLESVMCGGDLLNEHRVVRKNYDYDMLKRKPIRESIERVDIEYGGEVYEKVRFQTVAWETAEEASRMNALRRDWCASSKGEINKLQTEGSVTAFLDYLDVYRYADTQASSLDAAMLWKGIVYMSKCGYQVTEISTSLQTAGKNVHNALRGKVAKSIIDQDSDITFIRVDRSDGDAIALIRAVIQMMPAAIRLDAFNVLTENPISSKSSAKLSDALIKSSNVEHGMGG